jgi:hypothetical protein
MKIFYAVLQASLLGLLSIGQGHALETTETNAKLQWSMSGTTPTLFGNGFENVLALPGTSISSLFFGQNAWMPRKIGSREYFGDLEELLCGTAFSANGLCVPAEVQASGVKLMRYGGISVDKHYSAELSPAQYLTMVDNMRTNHIEPLLQVPYFAGVYGPTIAADLVRFINITHQRGVKYWTIANEPNTEYCDTITGICANAQDIATYFKVFATAMKNVDPTILIAGPDLSWYNATIMNELTTPHGPNDICGRFIGADGLGHYYLDIIDFHTYPFAGDANQTRAAVIAWPQGSFQNNVVALKARVDACNSAYARAGSEALKLAVTEINVEYRNPVDLSLGQVSAQSFLAGQFWADVMNVGMKHGLTFIAFWSVKEGNPQLGYIANNGTALPTYYHYQMLAQNFRGGYITGTHWVNGAAEPNVKAFGAIDQDQIVVMLLNEKQNTSLGYTVRLDGAAVSGSNALKVNIEAGIDREYHFPANEVLAAQSTVMLVFDAAGNLRARHVYGLSSGYASPTIFAY